MPVNENIAEELLVSIRLRTEAFETGIAQVGQSVEQLSQQSAKAAQDAAQSIEQAQAKVAASATVAFAVIVAAIMNGVDAANEYRNAMVGLQSLAQGAGQDFGQLEAAAKDLTSDGLMPVSDAAAALKNLLARGFSTQEAVDMIKRLKDASAFGRQGQLSMGEAVKSATEGLKNENSVLVDNAGVTKNVSVMWAEYAASIGKSAAQLTMAEKRQAEYNGIMQETAYQVGDAARYAQEFAGKQAALEAATLRVNQALGIAAQDGLEPWLDVLTPVVDGVAQLIEQQPALTAGLGAAGVAAVALTAGMLGLKLAAKGLREELLAIKTIAPELLILSAVAGAVVGLTAAMVSAENRGQQLAKQIETLKGELQDLSADAADAEVQMAVLDSATSSTQALAAAKNQLAQIFPELVIGYDSEGNAIMASNELIREQIELLKQKRELKLKEMQETAAAATAEAQRDRDETERMLRQLEQEKAELEEARRQYEAEYGASAASDEYYNEELAAKGEAITAMNLALQQSEIDLAAAMEAETAIADELAGKREETASAAEEAAAATSELTNATEALEAAQSAAKEQQRTRQLKSYVNEVKNGTKGTQTYEKAVQALQDAYGSLYPDIEQNIGAIEALVSAEDEQAQAAVDAARTAIQNLIAVQQAIIDTGNASAQAAAQAASLISVLSTLDQALASLGTGELPAISVSKASSGSGGGGSGKSRWEMELDELEHYAKLGEDVTQRQIEAIERILATEKLSTEERWRLEEELYEKTNDLLEQRIDLYKGLTQLTVEEASYQAAALQAMLNTYVLTAEEQAALTEQLIETKKALDGDYLRDYIAHLERILAEEKLNAAQRKNVLGEIMQARISLMQQERDAMRSAIDDQIEAIEERRDAQLKAIDEEIDALDKLLQARKRAQQDEDDQDALRRLQESLKYEKDDYNRQQLEKQIEEKQKEIADRKFEEDIQDRKDALRAQQDAIREAADAEIKALQDLQEQRMDWYELQLEQQMEYSEQSLEAQQLLNDERALKLEESNAQLNDLTHSGQQANVDALLSYKGAMGSAGDELGGAIAAAMESKFAEIEAAAAAMAASVVATVSSAMAQLQALQGMGNAVVQQGKAAANVSITQNFNTPTATPSSMRAASRQLAQELAK